jgi:nucleoside 2-deoxyribosyltransferase
MDIIDVDCPRCGNFPQSPGHGSFRIELSKMPAFLAAKGVAVTDLGEANRLIGAYLSVYTRECTNTHREPELINLLDPKGLERLAETYAFTPIPQKFGKLLRLIAERTAFPGSSAHVNLGLDYPALHAVEPREMLYYLRGLLREGLIEVDLSPVAKSESFDDDDLLPTVTLAGWKTITNSAEGSKIGFVAMSFATELDTAYSEGIEPAIREAGYEPLRVDRVEHNEKICDRIVAEIRRSLFLVADVTNQKPGVYFEAGLAMALGQQVIWSCREDDKNNVHFDTRQYNHIFWKSPAELRERLRDRIAATIGHNA